MNKLLATIVVLSLIQAITSIILDDDYPLNDQEGRPNYEEEDYDSFGSGHGAGSNQNRTGSKGDQPRAGGPQGPKETEEALDQDGPLGQDFDKNPKPFPVLNSSQLTTHDLEMRLKQILTGIDLHGEQLQVSHDKLASQVSEVQASVLPVLKKMQQLFESLDQPNGNTPQDQLMSTVVQLKELLMDLNAKVLINSTQDTSELARLVDLLRIIHQEEIAGSTPLLEWLEQLHSTNLEIKTSQPIIHTAVGLVILGCLMIVMSIFVALYCKVRRVNQGLPAEEERPMATFRSHVNPGASSGQDPPADANEVAPADPPASTSNV